MKKYRRHIALIAIAIQASALVIGQNFEMPMETDPASTTLKILPISSEIEVIGIEENVIRLRMEGLKSPPRRAEGLRPLFNSAQDNTGLGLELMPLPDDSKTLILRKARQDPGKTLRLEIPRQLVLNIDADREDVSASKLSGEITAKMEHGDIRLEEVTGPLIVNTTHGNIDVILAQMNQEYPSSLTAVHGHIDIEIDESEKFEVGLQVKHGEIYTNLDLEINSGRDGMSSLAGGRKMRASMNGGGPQIDISAIHGDIYLRKSE